MRVDRGLLGWGVFFIVLGAVPLAVRSGTIDASAVRRAWELWPLILVGIGLALVLSRTRLAVVGGLVVAVTFGLMGGALLATGIGWSGGFGSWGFGSCGSGTGSSEGGAPFETHSGAFSGDATVHFELNCGALSATAVDGSAWTVSGTSEQGRAPEVSATDRRLVVRSPGRSGIDLGAKPWRWEVTLPRAGAVTMELAVNAGSGRLDLAGMQVPAMDVTVNAGDARVDMSGAGGTGHIAGSANAGSLVLRLPTPPGTATGSLSANAGSVKMCAPDGVALRFRTAEAALGSYDLGRNGDLVHIGNTWATPGFETATQRIDLTLSANLGSIKLASGNDCD
jgi:hypothetical protein